jgi:hypothetical protein
MFLADDLGQRARTHPIGQRLCGRAFRTEKTLTFFNSAPRHRSNLAQPRTTNRSLLMPLTFQRFTVISRVA